MNENNKQVQIQIQLPRITRILFDANKILEKKNLSLDLGDNPKSHGPAKIPEFILGYTVV